MIKSSKSEVKKILERQELFFKMCLEDNYCMETFPDSLMDTCTCTETNIPVTEKNFIGYKKAYGVLSGLAYIVELWIPEEAKRSSATRNMCRCSKAKVLSITTLDGTETDETEVHGWFNLNFIYRLGETVEVSDYDECPWHRYTSGIHFFLNREGAVNY